MRADIRARNLEASLSFQSSRATEEAQGKRVASRLIWMLEMICGGGGVGVGNGHFNRVYRQTFLFMCVAKMGMRLKGKWASAVLLFLPRLAYQ